MVSWRHFATTYNNFVSASLSKPKNRKNPKIIKIPGGAYIAGTKISELAPSRRCRGRDQVRGWGWVDMTINVA